MAYKYTKYQVARGTMPDAEIPGKYFLIKQVSEMRATYQVRLLIYFAFKNNKKLIIEVPRHCKIHSSLEELKKHFIDFVVIKRN